MAVAMQLEPRSLLSANLAVLAGRSTLPSSLLTNASARGAITVSLSNAGVDAFTRSTSKVDLEVRLLNGSASSGAVVGTVKKVSVGGLTSTSRPKTLKVLLKIPKTTAAGSYHLVVIADPKNALGESADDQANNIAQASQALVIAAPFSQLQVDHLTYKYGPKGPGTAIVYLRNAGNVASKGKVDLSIFASSQSIPGSLELAEAPAVKVSIPKGRTAAVGGKLKIAIPTNSDTAPAAFTISASITPRVTPADAGTAADRKGTAAASFTVAPATRTAQSPLIPGLGTSLTFTATTTQSSGVISGLVGETGTVLDNNHRQGTYSWAYIPPLNNNPADITLTLNFPTTPTQAPLIVRYRVSFAGTATTALNGKTLTFGTTPDSNSGQVKINNRTGSSTSPDAGVSFTVG